MKKSNVDYKRRVRDGLLKHNLIGGKMDKTKKYIMMCEKAEEIQKYYEGVRWGHTGGNSIPYKGTLHVLILREDFYLINANDGVFVIPRQDQLQEMLFQFKGNSATIFNTLDELRDFMRENIYEFDTLEQFWLAFVMLNNYNKSWIDLEWK